MIRQQDDREYGEWMLRANTSNDAAKCGASQFSRENRSPLVCHDRKEKRAPLAGTAVVAHSQRPMFDVVRRDAPYDVLTPYSNGTAHSTGSIRIQTGAGTGNWPLASSSPVS